MQFDYEESFYRIEKWKCLINELGNKSGNSVNLICTVWEDMGVETKYFVARGGSSLSYWENTLLKNYLTKIGCVSNTALCKLSIIFSYSYCT